MLDQWQKRLIAAIDERLQRDGLKDRGLSIDAKLGPNFVEQLRKGGRIPRIETLRKIAAYLGLSLHYVLFGQDVTAEEEELLLMVRGLDEPERQVYLTALRGMSGRAASVEPPASAQAPSAGTLPE